jgi:L,D-transpeptidase catalytic domain
MSVSLDGTARYVWPVSTGRPGYDTPNGIFKANRMDADHLSQEWENAPMPHTIFFDVRGHAVHGFFDVKHLGLPVSHGCVRLSPAHAATLFDLVKAEGMNQTTIVVSGHTPAGGLELVSRRAPVEQASTQPVESVIVTDESLARCVSDVRKALGDADQRIVKTMTRRGYLFASPVTSHPVHVEEEGFNAPAAALPDKPSIAVLPFKNMSGDPEQEYFADGVVEEIITALSRFRHIFVIARDSSFTYKGRSADVKKIGRELGVRYVLEGSVRKVGEQGAYHRAAYRHLNENASLGQPL